MSRLEQEAFSISSKQTLGDCRIADMPPDGSEVPHVQKTYVKMVGMGKIANEATVTQETANLLQRSETAASTLSGIRLADALETANPCQRSPTTASAVTNPPQRSLTTGSAEARGSAASTGSAEANPPRRSASAVSAETGIQSAGSARSILSRGPSSDVQLPPPSWLGRMMIQYKHFSDYINTPGFDRFI